MPPVGFEPTISAGERPQTYALDRAVTGTGNYIVTYFIYTGQNLSFVQFIHSFVSIQPQRPAWQEPEPSHVTGMALAHCILGKFLGVVCHVLNKLGENIIKK